MRKLDSARYASLDHWRGLACLAVVAYHAINYADDAAGPAAAGIDLIWFGGLGVPVFFVISGYCIAASADTARRSSTPAGEFFRKRLRRIFPPYLAAVAIAAPIVWLFDSLLYPGLFNSKPSPVDGLGDLSGWQWLGCLTLTEGWRHHLVGDKANWFLGQAWTLAYEEQFYAVVGLLLIFCRRRLFEAVLAITAVEVPLKHLLWPPLGATKAGVFFDGHWEQFAAGILVFWLVNHARGINQVAAWGLLALGTLYAFRDGLPGTDSISRLRAPAAWSFAVLLAVLHPFDARVAAARLGRPLARCGAMCYSLYLMHWPLTKGISHALADAGLTSPAATLLVTVPACLAASLAAARAFHVAVERRFLTDRIRPAHSGAMTTLGVSPWKNSGNSGPNEAVAA